MGRWAVPGADAPARRGGNTPLDPRKAATITDTEQYPAYTLSVGELVALRFLVMIERDRETDAARLPDDVFGARWAEHTAWFDSRCRLLSPSGVRDLAIADVESAEVDPFSAEEIAALQQRYGHVLVRLGGSFDEPARSN